MRNLRENFPQSTGNRAENAQDPKQPSGQTGSQNPASDDAWKIHFSLGANVRFTRTPEVELLRRRGEELPSINERTQAEAAPEISVEKVAEAQPMAVAQMQKTVSQSMVRSPIAPVPPAMPAVPVAVVAASAEPALEVAPVAVEPVAADIVNPAKPSAFTYLSDFAFWEGCDIDTAIVPAEPLVSAVPAEPRKPLPTVESILAQFRIREWNKQPAPAAVATIQPVVEAPVAIAPVETVAPKPVATVQVETPAPQPIVAAPEIAPEVIGEATEDEVVLTVAEAEEHVFEEVVVPEPVIEKPVAAKAAPSIALYQPQPLPRAETPVIHGSYEFPPRDLLQMPPEQDGNVITQEMLERSAGLLESVLEDFGVRGEIIHVRPGPVVTLYEFEPAPGVKSSRVIGLADDIARSMSALSARVAVVPGRNVIGIELPNANRETVYLREMIDSRTFEASNYRLPLCLGKGIGGEPIIAELAKMPHLLVAGTTGSGKSVAINTMILSLLYRFKPEECRLIMVDPKMLELSIYDGIPHLLTPVVTDPKKAVVALKWAVREMEERYRKMARLGVRNIEGFNARAASAKGKGETVMCTVQSGFDKETGEATYIQEELDLTPMPYIVVIIDEMADLMMVAGKDIEGAVQRLAQMARAAGIHLIMATQRPSVDVITGTIKANFPTRISFQVTSKIDSRTILGEMGAEQLLGQGDMLHMAGGGRIVRVHGPFVSDEEVEKVVNHLKEQGRPDYLATVTEDEEDEDATQDAAVFDATSMGSEDGDDVYEQAIKVVMRDKKCSTSYIQRRLGIGYNRAASLVERMEKDGLVGPANHVGKREILTGNRD
ncbi:DNA translocase FtsK [Brucella anthropi]|uniref:Cell divisionFtsK/SpoIIIE n=1 Tax=Brucella anthropi (strain ATCC 49188 / DSM 6882 / CCUG 24695 / JCM 21032 / LMG 3331 / NBRC 15819 / NCTC 12168 / Alc 37) TaxID=439375 RepID=A6X4V9_BRUA4|nr:DNA translocase FtsK [Brucella anthropi]ABS16263.1 cell divisionFtsK/SpoIIIE [Brucella anthropi ATCC 49188]AIK42225.1 ftsK/SpoIIIE family protein [Brucella anthropi]KAB2741923.1 DNA translocase FtsK [Brucella anthropi]KAB2754469.1 DNA translocase FtsK [Brucella anthropi]KAB2781337.1 DNA translocase FtsK [Brucella anthropi]